MDALKGYIGFRITGDETPPSGEFINDLNGISLKMLDNIAGEEQENFHALWLKIEHRALLKFEVMLRARILKNYSILDADVIACVVTNNKANLTMALIYFLGIEVMLERLSSERTNYFTTIGQEEAKEQRDQYQVEFAEAFDLGTSCLDIGACLPVPRHVDRNQTYSVRASRF